MPFVKPWPTPEPYLLPSQGTLDALRQAMANTRIMCAVMLDTKVGGGQHPDHVRCHA